MSQVKDLRSMNRSNPLTKSYNLQHSLRFLQSSVYRTGSSIYRKAFQFYRTTLPKYRYLTLQTDPLR